MIVVDCEQGSWEWIQARLGIPTASAFSRVLTSGGKLSASREPYKAELLAEWALGEPIEEWQGNEWTERGKYLEPQARRYYALQRDIDPEQVGFVYQDDKQMVGCSPDALVGEPGLLELKCPLAGNHLLYLVQNDVPKKYQPQCQGSLWVTGREWIDFMSYFPGLPPLIIRVAPDPKIQDALSEHMPVFIAEIEDARGMLEEMGITAASVGGPPPEIEDKPATMGDVTGAVYDAIERSSNEDHQTGS